MCSIICGREATAEELYDVKGKDDLCELKSSNPPLYQRARTEFSFPRIVVRDRTGRELNTYTSLQEAIYRAKWNVQTSKTSVYPDEWRLPKAPVPSRPDYTRAVPVQSRGKSCKQKEKSGYAVTQSAPSGFAEEIDIDDVAYVAECIRQLPRLPQKDEIATGDKVYLEIVAHLLLHKKVVKGTDKRNRSYEFPGFCKGCLRSGLCYGCDMDSQPHIHKDRQLKTGGGYTFWKKDRPVNQKIDKNLEYLPVMIPAVELRQLLEDTTLSEAAKEALKKRLVAQYPWLQDLPFDNTILDHLRSKGLLSEDGQAWKEMIGNEDEGSGAEDTDLYRISRSRLENWISLDDEDADLSGRRRSRRSPGKRSQSSDTEQKQADKVDGSENEETEDTENKQKRPKLYNAPKPFKLKEKTRRVTVAESPFSSNRQYDLSKGSGFQLKKSDKKTTEFLEFNRAQTDWKEPNRFQLKKDERKPVHFWVPKIGDKKKTGSAKDEYDYDENYNRNRKNIERPLSPDSGLASEIVSALKHFFDTSTKENKQEKIEIFITATEDGEICENKNEDISGTVDSQGQRSYDWFRSTENFIDHILDFMKMHNRKDLLVRNSFSKVVETIISWLFYDGSTEDTSHKDGGGVSSEDVMKLVTDWMSRTETDQSQETSHLHELQVQELSEIIQRLRLYFTHLLLEIQSQDRSRAVRKPLLGYGQSEKLNNNGVNMGVKKSSSAGENGGSESVIQNNLRRNSRNVRPSLHSWNRRKGRALQHDVPRTGSGFSHLSPNVQSLELKSLENKRATKTLLRPLAHLQQIPVHKINDEIESETQNPNFNETKEFVLFLPGRGKLRLKHTDTSLKDINTDGMHLEGNMSNIYTNRSFADEEKKWTNFDEISERDFDSKHPKPAANNINMINFADLPDIKTQTALILNKTTNNLVLKENLKKKVINVADSASSIFGESETFASIHEARTINIRFVNKSFKDKRNGFPTLDASTNLSDILIHDQLMSSDDVRESSCKKKKKQIKRRIPLPNIGNTNFQNFEKTLIGPPASDRSSFRMTPSERDLFSSDSDTDLDLDERSRKTSLKNADVSVKDSLNDRESTLITRSTTEGELSSLTQKSDTDMGLSDTDLLQADSARRERKEIVKKTKSPLPPRQRPPPKAPTPEPQPTEVDESTPEPPSREKTLTPAHDEPYTSNISMPDLPEFELQKKEAQRKLSKKFFVEAPPELKEQPKKRKPPPKIRRIPKVQYNRKSRPAEAPVSSDKLQEIHDPLDFLAKYCIINPNRLPFYQLVFESVIEDQIPKYSTDQTVKFSDHEKKLMTDLAVLNHGRIDKIGLSPPEVYLEKICYTLEMIHDKVESLTLDLQNIDDQRAAVMVTLAKDMFPGITFRDYSPPKKKKGKKGKKKKAEIDEAVCHVRGIVTDEIILNRLTSDMIELLNKEPDIRQLNLERERTLEKITGLKDRLQTLQSEKILADALSASCYFEGRLDNKKPEDFRRQQSKLYNTLRPDPDFEMNLDELEDALQQINNHLLTTQEFKFLYFVLDLPGRRRINFRLFTVIAALSEKVTQLDPVIRKLINKFDYNALNVKMDKCKELFSLLIDDELSTPRGGASATSLAMELTAGGLKPEHVHYVLSKFNREGKGVFDFLDFVTYIPLFIEIHQRIVRDPLREEKDL